jgi:chemotaxis signal transduction protein
MLMINDVTTSTVPAPSHDALAKNLIAALTKLQQRDFEKELLDGGAPLTPDAKAAHYFGFSIGSHHFMVAASSFCEVFVDTPIAAMPNAPSCLAGLVNVRGVLMPVYQLHSALKVDSPKKFIIFSVGKGESAVGVLIDGLPISLEASAYQRQAPSVQEQRVLQQFSQTHYFVNQHHWLLFDGAVLSSQLVAFANESYKSQMCLSAGVDPAYI